LLAASSVPALGDTALMSSDRASRDEVLLSSAPVPFSRSSRNVAGIEAVETPPRRRWRRSWVGVLIVASACAVAGAWWSHRSRDVVVSDPDARDLVEDAPDADVRSGRPGSETPTFVEVPSEPVPEEVSVSSGVEPLVDSVDPVTAPPPPPKRKPRRPRLREIVEGASSEAPAVSNEPLQGQRPSTRGDDGIDWTVPGFPEDELEAPTPNTSPTVPGAPTGTPNAPAANPVVIDEVPAPSPSK
ncbi:MAG: hypothetical protein WBG86_10775, partial [Polyangiales bacterium]